MATSKQGWTTSDGRPEFRMNPELLRQGTSFRRSDKLVAEDDQDSEEPENTKDLPPA